MAHAGRIPIPGRASRIGVDLTPRHLNGQAIAYVLVFAAVGCLVLFPVVMLLMTSVNLGPIVRVESGASLANFLTAWSSSTTYSTIGNTLVFALGATALAVALGVFFAFLVERTDMPMKGFA